MKEKEKCKNEADIKNTIKKLKSNKQIEAENFKILSVELLLHMRIVQEEIEKLINEYINNPEDIGHFENRLYWAMKGINPNKAVCVKHKKKLQKNVYGEFMCSECVCDILEDLENGKDTYDEGYWYDPKNKPTLEISGIRYGIVVAKVKNE